MNKNERIKIYKEAKILWKKVDYNSKFNKKAKSNELLEACFWKLSDGFSQEEDTKRKFVYDKNTKIFLQSVFRWGKKLYINHQFQSFHHFCIYIVVASTKIDIPSLLVKLAETNAELSIQKIVLEEAINKNKTKLANESMRRIKELTMYLSAYEQIKKRKEYFSKLREVSILVLIPTIATCLTAILVPIYV